MNKYSSEKQWKEILGATFRENQVIDRRMEEAYTQLRKESRLAAKKKKSVRRRIVIGTGSAAAVFVMMILLCAMNPVLASEIPILGDVFEKVADIFSFGKLPEEETTVFPVGRDEADSPTGAEEEPGMEKSYSQKDGDVTITLTEEYASNQAVYIGVCVESEKGFPAIAVYTDGSQNLKVETVEEYSFREDSITSLRNIEGRLENEHTFIGIMRIDYSEINVDERKFREMVKEAEEAGAPVPAVTDENYLQYMDYYEIPSSFDLALEVTQIIGDLADPLLPKETKSQQELEQMSDEEWEAYMKSKPQFAFPNDYENWYQKGSWKFAVAIAQRENAGRVIEINEVGENGIGMESIELSAVEMTLHPIEPAGADTFAVALDADGNKLESGNSGNAYVLATAGHDISTVYIYVCDYMEYMDELKGYAYATEQGEKSFQEILEERALFRTVVNTVE